MKKFLPWILGGLALLIAIAAVGIWLGSNSVERRVEELSAQATQMGMHVEFDPPETDPVVQDLASKIVEWQGQHLPEGDVSPYVYSEHEDDVKVLAERTKEILPGAYEFSESVTPAIGGIEGYLALSAAADVLAIEVNNGFLKNDLELVLQAASAIRRLANTPKTQRVTEAVLLTNVAHTYFCAIQNSAESAGSLKELRAIEEELNKWSLNDFSETAKYLPAFTFDMIQRSADRPLHGSILHRLSHVANSTHLALTKKKMFALEDVIRVYPKWSNDREFLEATRRGTFSFSEVRRWARELKTADLRLRLFILAARAVVLARKEVLAGRAWPTIEQLEKQGLEMTDPIHRKLYEWREFGGKQRLFGQLPRLREGDGAFVLLTPHEDIGGAFEVPSL